MSVVTYGGIALQAPAPQVAAFIEANISLGDANEFAYQNWPGRNRVAWPFQYNFRRCVPRLGRLHWPVGASRWGSFHAIATNTTLKAIRTLAYSGNTLNALNLVFDDGNSRVVTVQKMYLLPARPLANQVAGGEALWLMTLVDQRYFWWELAALIGITGTSTSLTGGTTTWANLFTSIAAALPGSPSITTDTIAAAYLKPSSDLVSNYEFVPNLLDAVCANVGHRLIVSLAGAITTMSGTTAAAQSFTPAAGWTIEGGGVWNLDQTYTSNDLNAAVPANVQVVFPQSTGTRNAGPYYTVNKTLTGLSLTRYGSAAGHPGTKVFKDSAVGNSNMGTPANATELGNLAGQIATDFYLWRIPLVDVQLDGAVPWTPEGYYDVIWDWTTGTRLVPGEFNVITEDFSHYCTSGAAAVEILPERPAIAKQTGTSTAASGYWAFQLQNQDGANSTTTAGNNVEVWDPNGVLSSTTAGSFFSVIPQDSLTSTPKRLFGIGINASTGMSGSGSTITIQGELTTPASPPTDTALQTGITGLKPNGTSGLYVEAAVSNVAQMGIFAATLQQAGSVSVGPQTWLGPKTVGEASVAGGGTIVSIAFTNANLTGTALANLQYDVPQAYGSGRDSTSAVLPSVIANFDLHDKAFVVESPGNNSAFGVIDSTAGGWLGQYGTTWEGNSFKGGVWVGATGQPVIDVPHGGTNRTALTAFNLIIGNGTSAVTLLPPGTINQPLVSMGPGSNPGYTVLTVPGGGTGGSTWTVGAVMLGNLTSTMGIASPVTLGYVLTDNGPGVFPTFQPLPAGHAAYYAGLIPGTTTSSTFVLKGTVNIAAGLLSHNGDSIEWTASGNQATISGTSDIGIQIKLGYGTGGSSVIILDTAVSTYDFTNNDAIWNLKGRIMYSGTGTGTSYTNTHYAQSIPNASEVNDYIDKHLISVAGIWAGATTMQIWLKVPTGGVGELQTGDQFTVNVFLN